ncbi:hypothetical protein Tco_0271057 [Tanacetum coccineum]
MLSSSNFKIIKKSFNPNSCGLAFRGGYTGGNRMNIFNVVAPSIKDVGAAWFSVKENQGLLGFSGKEDSRLVKVARFLRFERIIEKGSFIVNSQKVKRIKALLEQQGLAAALEELPAATIMA